MFDKKEIIIILLLICVIFSLQAVAASETGSNSTDDGVVLSTDNATADPISKSDIDESLLGDGSFNDLSGDVSGSDVILTKNYTFTDDTVPKSGIVISQDKTIDGQGTVVIDANHKSRIFTIKTGATVTLKGITFKNAYFEGHGGAIFTNGTVILENCKFIDNTAYGGNGGAIMIRGSGSSITDCEFSGNKAIMNKTINSPSGAGGSVMLVASNITISHSTFTDNRAGLNGGAIASSDAQPLFTNCTITNCTFENNMANGSAGAVGMQLTNFNMYNSTFKYNEAKGLSVTGFPGNGGGIVVRGSDSYIYNSTFINNTANNGGAVFLTNTSVVNENNNTGLEYCKFINNTANVNGGAINWVSRASHGYIKYSNFTNNIAKRSGGAVYWSGTNGTVEHSNFTGNKALGIASGKTPLGETTMGGDAGALMWTGSLGDIKDCRFVNNSAAKRGGAVFLQPGSDGVCDNVSFEWCTFRDNVAGTDGGAIDWYTGAKHGIVNYGVFINNTAQRSGGAIFWHGTNGTIKHSNFTDNRATGEALEYDMSFNMATDVVKVTDKNEIPLAQSSVGKLYVVNQTISSKIAHFESYVVEADGTEFKLVKLDEIDIEISESIISPVDWAIDQFFGGDGGTILWSGDTGLVYNCTFTGSNSARRGGGAYMTGSDNVTYNLCTFTNCTSGTNGGGVDWLAGANYGKIYNCVFNNTRAARSAGAIYYDGWYGDLQNITIINTRSWGGTLNESDDKRVKYAGWDSSHWDTNTTGGDAGAIMFTGSNIKLYNVTFINGTAQGRGGAVFLQDNKNITFDLCRFIGCEALGIATNTWDDYKSEYDGNGYNYKLTGHGGAIAFDVNAHDSTIKNSEFTQNYARRDGGAINIAEDSYNFTIENTKFTNNSCGDDGGAINWVGDLGLVKNITCYNNTGTAYADPVTGASTSLGGTMCIEGHNVTVTKSSFTISTVIYNQGTLTKTNAGAIAISGNNTTISHSTFDRCTSPNNAGAISIIGAHTEIINCTFENCNATEDGGAIEVNGTDCKLYNSTFTDNFAGDDGGAINWIGSNGYVYNITCTNNKAIGFNDSHSVGGSISLAGSNIILTNSSFTDSYAVIAGGAIYIRGADDTVANSTFNGCTVEYDNGYSSRDYVNGGGAIYITGNNANVLKCTFDDCNGREGGVIYIQGNDATIDSTTTNSYAVNGGAFYVKGDNAVISTNTSKTQANYSGGAIYIYGVNALVNNSVFDDAEALGSGTNIGGGAIFIRGNYAKVNNSKVNNSVAQQYGGAIYIWGHYANITHSNITESKVTTSSSKGGGIYVYLNYAEIIDTFLGECSSVSDGGAIYINGQFTKITNSTINESKSKNGGGVFIQGNNATIIGTAFNDNFADSSAGALYSNGKGSQVYNSTFTANKLKGAKAENRGTGGAIFWNGGSMNDLIEGCNFTDNLGGVASAIYVTASSVDTAGTIRNCNFIHNDGFRAGAIGWASSNHALIEGCYFVNNTSVKHGAGIYAGASASAGSEFKVFNCTFEGNVVSAGVGGAISMRISNSEILSCRFIGNSASQGGSIIIKETGVKNILIDDCNFTNSVAFAGGTEDGSGGGAIAVWGVDPWSTGYITNNVTISNCNFKNCSSLVYSGGAIDLTASLSLVENCTFVNCSAPYGGSIGFSTQNTNLNNLTIINSTSITYGGAIYIGYIKVKGVEFNNPSDCDLTDIKIINATSGMGGAIYMDELAHDLTFDNISISSSYASSNGGAIYIIGQKITISNSNFTNNTAGGNGGAIFTNSTVENGPITINNTIFVINHADADGGAIYLGHAGSKVTYCNFTNNTAGGNGGAIVIASNNQFVSFSNFKGNNATANGGAIYVMDVTDINITDSTFEDSFAYNGGAIYNKGTSGASVWINNDTFLRNIASHNGGAVLYIVNANTNPIVYRDYNNFDDHGVDAGEDRTDLTVTAGSASIQTIFRSYFKDNQDYILDAYAVSYQSEVYAVIIIEKPKDVDRQSANITITLINNKTGEITYIIINNETYDKYYNSYYNRFEVDLDVVKNQTYNVTVSFKDGNYMEKNYNTTFKTAEIIEYGDFKRLQMLIEDSISNRTYEINLNRSYHFTPDLDTGCMNLTNIPDGITLIINGNGRTIDARGFSRIFNITSNNIIFNNVVFENGNASGNRSDNITLGGAIYWAGENGELINCTFRNNFAEYGGGLYYASSALNAKIENSIFRNNNATYNGGAIDCNAPAMNLTNTLFESNYADTGAALCREVNATRGFGYNNRFISNRAVSNGAALAWINASSISIDTYYFSDNTAGVSGGAIYVGNGSGNCRIENCIFEDNYVTNTTGGHGGAIEWYAREGLVSNSNFTNNHAYNGGAIYVGSDSGYINITKSNFHENHASTRGGAISLDASSVTINASNFYDNYAQDGGAVYVGGEGITNHVYSSVFERNEARNGLGGAIDWVASSGNIRDSNFTSNFANYGGGVYFGGKSSESAITNCIFDSNEAKYNGGAIDCNSSKMNLTTTLFKSNKAQFGAALCREANSTGGFGVNNVFISNHAYVAGAALGWMGSVGITITNYTFINNTADISGGAIYVGHDSHNCTIIGSRFENNYISNESEVWTGDWEWTAWDLTPMKYSTIRTDDENLIGTIRITEDRTFYYYSAESGDNVGVGGAIDILAANATVKESNFTNNTADYGGAIYVGTDNGNTRINGSIFTDNHAYVRGGAVNLHASAVSINNSEFYDNDAVDGGALFVSGSGVTNYVLNSVFEGNNATGGHGGAIEWVASQGHIQFTNFTRNTADYGGAIFFNGESHNSSVINVIFKENNATYNGGAIDWDAKYGQLYNTTFISNYAGEYGAALCRESGATQGKGKNNTFIANHAGRAGAALAWMDVDGININDYHFINNTADHYGGAIYISDGSDNCVVNNSYFTGNHITNYTAGNGGAISIVGNNASIINSNFTLNSAYYGGAIFAGDASGDTRIDNVLFDRNQAYLDGGAVQIRGSGVVLNNTRLYNNTAEQNGGAIYLGGTGENNMIYFSEFIDNSANSHGGAIDWRASAGDIFYSNFTRNTAENGGAIYLNGVSAHSRLANLIFTSNEASKNGGAIDCNATQMNLTNTQFTSNNAGAYGAALCREANATGGFGINNTFTANHADIAGAALAWLGVSNININNYTFINNTAGESGGAIYVSADSENCKVRNSHFDNNYVTDVRAGEGGAINWLGANGYINDTEFKNSFAAIGGTLHIVSKNMTIENSNFSYSFALIHGGTIAAHNSDDATINNCIILNSVGSGYVDSTNNTYGEGGAIYWEDSNNLNISNTRINDTESHGNGAVSLVSCNDSELYNVTFKGAITIRNGGSLSWVNSHNITIDDCEFIASASSYDGGSIYLNNIDDAVVKNSLFNNTSALWGNGGAIYVNGNATLDNNVYDDFKALNDNAGGIYLHAGNSTISNSSFNGYNTILVGKNATGIIVKNNITGENSNRDLCFLEDDYNSVTNPVLFSVWNSGNLTLQGNNFTYLIFNDGTIFSQTYTYMMGKEAYETNYVYNVTYMDPFTFWAEILDDTEYNHIISVDTLWATNNVDQDVGSRYPMKYNRVKIPESYIQGHFQLQPEDASLKQNARYNGTVNVKMPLYLKLEKEIHDGNVIIKATLTPKVRSNFTLANQLVFRFGGKNYPVDLDVNYEKIGNFNYTWTLAIGKYEFNNLAAGHYTVYANYTTDDVHEFVENSTEFDIEKRDTWISVIVEDYAYGFLPQAMVNTTGNGTVLVSIGGRTEEFDLSKGEGNHTNKNNVNYTIKDGILYVPFDTKYDPGNYTVSVVYRGDDYYEYALNSTNFTVFKLNTTISATSINASFWQNEEINVTVNKNATGYIKITIPVRGVDEDYVAVINNGTARFSIPNLFGGDYKNVKIVYNGDTHFNGNETYINFTIKATTDFVMNVSVDNIEFGQNATVLVLLPTLADGNVTIFVDGENRGTVNVTNGLAKLNVAGLYGGTHYVNATYNGGVNYAAKNVTDVEFNVTSTDNWKMTITSDEHPYGENTTITVSTLPYNVTGKNLTLIINNVPYVVNITNGVATFTINNLSAGVYISKAVYNGDANYSAKNQTFRVKIVQATPTVYLTEVNGNIIATVSGNATGNVTFYVNGKPYTENITNGNATLSNDKLIIGDNNIVAIYNGDGNYTTAIAIKNFPIDKITTNMTVVATPEVVVGKNTTIVVTMVNVTTGKVMIEVNGYNYTVDINDGEAILVIALPVGEYNATAYFLGDANHTKSNNISNTFKVLNKTVPELNITAPVSVEIDNNITFEVNRTGNGTLTVKVNGEVVIKGTDGKYHFNKTNVAGTYTITAELAGNDYYFEVSESKTVEVYKHASEITSVVADPTSVFVGKNTTITVTMAGNETGKVVIEVGGHNYTVTINGEHKAILIVALPAGNYTAKAYYLGDDKYNVTDKTSEKFNVTAKKEANITISVPKVTIVGNNVTISITNSTPVNVTLNGKEITLKDGNYTFNATVVGNYTVIVRSAETDEYYAGFNSTVFNVIKRDTYVNITIDGDNVIEIENNITFTVNTNSNGTLVVKINNKVVTIGTDGKYHFNGTVAGNYTITAEVAANGYYDAVFNSTTFKVIKHQAKVNITVDERYEIGTAFDILIGNNTVVNVTINGVKYTVTGGKVVIDTTKLAAGNYTVIATIFESDKYYANITSETFEIYKHTAVIKNITVPASDVVMGKNATIIVNMDNVTSGTVLIEVDGHNYTVAIVDKVANLTVELPTGEYTARAYYLGDDNYTSAAPVTSGKFKVLGKERALVNITIIGSDVIEIDSNITFNVTSNSNATPLVVKVNGKVVETIGNNQYRFNGTVEGNYTITAEIAGNEYYVAGFNLTTFKVVKHQGKVNITVENRYEIGTVFDILIGNNTVVNVTINGVKYAVADGKVTIDTDKLAAGNYTVIATVFESDKYYGNVTNKTFEIYKHTAVIDYVAVPTVNVTEGESVTITVKMGNVTSGSVLIEVGGHNYTAEINTDGIATLIVELPDGEYKAKAYYLGDANYTPATKDNATKFKVGNKTITKVNITLDENVIEIDNNITFTVETDSNATLTVKVNGQDATSLGGNRYTFNGTVAGNYTITAEVAGNNYYTAAFNSTMFKVIKHNAAVNITVDATYHVDEAFNIIITNDTAVNVTINGKEYAVVDGKVIIPASELKAGHYIITATIYESDKYVGNSTTKEFDVIKYDEEIASVAGTTVMFGDKTTITVTMANVVTGKVIIEVNGTNYTVDIKDKVAELTITLPVGKYNATAYFLGDDKYNKVNKTSAEFEVVNQTVPAVEIIAPASVEVENNLEFTVTYDGNGTLVVKVDGKVVELTGDKYIVKMNSTGNFTITAEADGNKYYYAASDDATVNVYRHEAVIESITVSNDETILGNNVTITVTMDNVDNGTVLIDIAGHNYTVEFTNKVAELTVELPVGNYTARAYFVENDMYNATVSGTVDFKVVYKLTPEIIITAPSEVKVGETVNITINTNGYNLTVWINDVKQTVTADGNVSFVADKPGSYTIVAEVSENATVYAASNFTVFTAVKSNATLIIDEIHAGLEQELTITVTNITDGKITIKVNGVEVTDGKFTPSTPGIYTVTVESEATDKYNAGFNVTSFTIDVKEPVVINIVAPETAKVGETIEISVSTNGYNLTVWINDVEQNVTDGVIKYTVTSAGINKIYAETTENITVYAATKTVVFEGVKNNATLIIGEITVVKVGDTVTITVTNVTDGEINVKVDGVEVTDGKFTPVTSGNYTITVESTETGIYNAGFNSTTFEVLKRDAPVSVTVEKSYYVGEAFNIIITNETVVNVTINGKEYPVVDGKVVISADELAAGHYIITAVIKEDNKYLANSTTKEFDILKLNSTVKVTGDSIKVDDVATIEITVPGDIDGTVKVDVNGTVYSVDIVGGEGSLDVKDLREGTYDINVTYIENDKYLSSFNDTAKITVTKVKPAVTVKVENITRGEVAIVNVTLPDDATGNVTVTIAGITVTSGVHGGVNSIIVPGLPSGEHTVDVTYSGNYKYESEGNSTKIKVSPESAPDGFSVDDLGNGTVVVTVPENATGTVAVKIGDNVYNATVSGGQAVIDLVNETPGTYNATVTYSGDENYTSMTTNKSVTIPKYETEISIDVNDTNVGDVAKVIVTLPENVTGNVTIEIDGKKYTNVTDSGVAVFNIEGLLAGNKTVTVTYAGDKWYVFNSTTDQFKVSKVATTVNITVSDHYVDEAFEIGIENATAVVVTINGKEYSVADGKVTVPADELAAGHYIVTATIVENDRYITDSSTKEFNILKLNSTVKVTADPINVSDTAVIVITVPDDMDATVTVNVNGTNYTVSISGGTGSLEINGLKAGTYDINVTYIENGKYLTSSNATTLTVSKVSSTVTVKVDNITVGDAALVNITVITGAGGNVTIKIGDEYEQTVGVTDGVISIAVPGLTVGDKTVDVTYNGDGKYLSSDASANFTVGRASTGINLVVENITYGQSENIISFINTTGNVTIKLNGDAIDTVDIVNGKVEYPLNLNAGNYTVEVIYNGNTNVGSVSASANFTVEKADLTINIDVSDITYGQVENIKVAVNAAGNVTIKVHTTDETIILSPDAELNVSDLPAGKYTVEVTYNGNDNYNSITQNATFNVAKANTTVSLEIESSLKWGETQLLNITIDNVNATGEVTINIDGVNYTAKLTNGIANFTTPKLAAGNHTVTVIYGGDSNLNGNWTSATVEVSKANAPFNITVEDVDSGENAVIKIVDLPEDATGYVIINVNGTEYGVNITETKELSVPINAAGKYDVIATYLGDDKYESSIAETSFNATKVSGNVSVEVSDAVAGGDVAVKVTVPDDATGNVTVTVGNQTKTVPVTGGENTIVISNVSEGENNVTVTYSGDSKYDSKTVTKTINVTTSIRAEDKLTRGWDSPYDFEAEFLDKQGHVLANTEVKFVVDGKTYTAKTDDKGIARLTDSNLAIGTYNVTCINPVTGQEVTKQVTIVKRIVENKDVKMDFRDGSKYTVKVIGDDGKPVGAGEFVAIKINGVTYAVKTNSKGYASLALNLNPKKYTVTAEYKNTKVSNKVTIKQTLKLVKKTVKVKKGKKIVLQAKLKWSNGKAIKGKKITFKFKGKKYNAKTNKKGIAKVTIKSKKVLKKLKKGKKYKFTATYYTNTVKGKVVIKK